MQSIVSNNERDELLTLAKNTAKDHMIVSCCIYGSKVAGYARPDSDYDLLLVLKDYDALIEYIYYTDSIDASILVVDSSILMKDAEKAALGEFVIGRLLHPYESLINDAYLKEVETIYKKRVVLDIISELAKTPFYKELIIPIKYFLLAKIQKRSKIYPHAMYSYIKTYTNQQGSKNLAFSLDGFKRALSMLDEHIEFYDEDNIIINKELTPERSYSDIINGIYAYLVHLYAGRSTLNFFRQEAKSKLKRRKEISYISKEFAKPESILQLKDTILLHEKDWLAELLEHMSMKDYKVTINKLGDMHAATSLYTIDNDTRLVAKQYASLKRLKWTGLNAWMIGLVKFDTSSSIRQFNEYKAIITLKNLGFNVPDIIGLSYKDKITITRYIEGITLDKIISDILSGKSRDISKVKEFGKLLYDIHKHGYMITDTKASNIIINDDQLYLTDLEQFRVDNDHTWDIVCFIYYSLKFTGNKNAARLIVKAFLDGYTNNKQNIECKRRIKYALSKKYLPPFYPAMVMNTVKAVWDEMHTYL
jgi:tRNA A-37 threonylcarbamoyl transferase component Bud32/predicted nucleotidyltransferase